MVRHLYTLGEVALIHPRNISDRLVTIVQALIAPSIKLSSGMLGEETAVFKRDSNTDEITISPFVRAHAFMALGKLCLKDHILAKKCINAFAKELATSEYAVVRNNLIVIMADLCAKYVPCHHSRHSPHIV